MKQRIVSNIDPSWPNIEVEYDKPIELFIDSLGGYNPNNNSFKTSFALFLLKPNFFEIDDSLISISFK